MEDVETNGVAPDPHDASMEAFERLLETAFCLDNFLQKFSIHQTQLTHALIAVGLGDSSGRKTSSDQLI